MAESTTQKVKVELIAGFILAGALAAIGYVWAFAPKAWDWLAAKCSSFFAYLASPGTVPTWWLYLLHFVLGCVALLLLIGIYQHYTDKEPSVRNYIQDNFFGAVWRWTYFNQQPFGTWAYCPTCDTQLVYNYKLGGYGLTKTTLHCEHCSRDVCEFSGDKESAVAQVERQINRKIRNGEWKNYVEPKA